jgi:hypothetical protein
MNKNTISPQFLNFLNEKTGLQMTLKDKDKSFLMKVFSIFLFFNSDFKNMITIIGQTIYVPRNFYEQNARDQTAVLYHEYFHAKQASKSFTFFAFKYLFPQILILPFLAIMIPIVLLVNVSALWLLAGFAFLTPVPAYWRYKFEWEAYYEANVFYDLFVIGKDRRHVVSQYVQYFTGPLYYFMWPFKKILLKKSEEYIESYGHGLDDQLKIEILNWLNNNGIITYRKG